MFYFLEKDWINLKILGCDTSVNTDGTLPHPLKEPKDVMPISVNFPFTLATRGPPESPLHTFCSSPPQR